LGRGTHTHTTDTNGWTKFKPRHYLTISAFLPVGLGFMDLTNVNIF